MKAIRLRNPLQVREGRTEGGRRPCVEPGGPGRLPGCLGEVPDPVGIDDADREPLRMLGLHGERWPTCTIGSD